MIESSTYQRRQELRAARDAAWALADRLAVIGDVEESLRAVLIARRLVDKLRDFDSTPKS